MIKYFRITLQDLWFKSDLQAMKAIAACNAVKHSQNLNYAREAVANHRAQLKDVRATLKHLLDKLDSDDQLVEEAFKEAKLQAKSRYLCGEIILGKHKYRVIIDMTLKKLVQAEWWWYSRYNQVTGFDQAVIESQIIVNGQVTATPTGEGLTMMSTIPY